MPTYKLKDAVNTESKEQFCKLVIDTLREHKNEVVRPVLITQEMMDVLQWKLRQEVKVQVDGVDIACRAHDDAPASFTDAVADACKPERSELELMLERAERAEAELQKYTRGLQHEQAAIVTQEVDTSYKRRQH